MSQYISKNALKSTLNEVSNLIKNAADAIFLISYVDQLLVDDPKACFGHGYPNPAKKAETIMKLTAKVGEPCISFYSAQEINDMFAHYGFYISDNKVLADLNSEYFGPVGRTLPENQIFNLEHFVVTERKSV